jgi:CBS-domain-containing membrane protein
MEDKKRKFTLWIFCAITVQLLLLSCEYFQCYTCFAPISATCVIVFCNPQSLLSQPLNILSSYFFAGFIGLLTHYFFPTTLFVEMYVLLLTLLLMILSGFNHPPAIALNFLLIRSDMPLDHTWLPVAQLIFILAFAYLLLNFVLKTKYPNP